jgi:hypothetical protein
VLAQVRQYEFYYVPASMIVYLTLTSMLRARRAELLGEPVPAWLITLHCFVVSRSRALGAPVHRSDASRVPHAQTFTGVWLTMMTDTASTPLPAATKIAIQAIIVVTAVLLFWIEVRRQACLGSVWWLARSRRRRAHAQIHKTENMSRFSESEQEVSRAACAALLAKRAGHSDPTQSRDRPQVCTIICARLDASALGGLLNVLVFAIKQLVNTALYRQQLVVVKTRPQIQYSVRLKALQAPTAAAPSPAVAFSTDAAAASSSVPAGLEQVVS